MAADQVGTELEFTLTRELSASEHVDYKPAFGTRPVPWDTKQFDHARSGGQTASFHLLAGCIAWQHPG